MERVVEAKLGAALAYARELDCELLLVADTVVLCEERILGKPKSPEHAASMIADLAGRSHVVASRFAIARHGKLAASETVRTKVWFRSLSSAEIARYVATGEGEDKARLLVYESSATGLAKECLNVIAQVLSRHKDMDKNVHDCVEWLHCQWRAESST